VLNSTGTLSLQNPPLFMSDIF